MAESSEMEEERLKHSHPAANGDHRLQEAVKTIWVCGFKPDIQATVPVGRRFLEYFLPFLGMADRQS